MNLLRDSLAGSDIQPFRASIANARRAEIATKLRIASIDAPDWTLVEDRFEAGRYRWCVGEDLVVQLAKKSPASSGGTRSLPGTEPLFSDTQVRRDERSLVHLRPWFGVSDQPILDVAHFEWDGRRFRFRWSLTIADIAQSAVQPMPAEKTAPRAGMRLKKTARRDQHGS